MSAGELCNRDVVVMEKGESVRDAARLMRDAHVGDIVVVEERQGDRVPVGIVTDRDLVVGVMAASVDPDRLTVGDIMSLDLLTVREDEELLEAIPRMHTKGVRRIPVVDVAGALQGILSVDDMIELVAEQISGLAALIRLEQRRERERRP
ncbi:MAG: CBS domain-containing protein [Proteobacteria bacterium]|nr:MAG: CBS domain-containing protein [Pseudomonadota bacterium]